MKSNYCTNLRNFIQTHINHVSGTVVFVVHYDDDDDGVKTISLKLGQMADAMPKI